MLESTNQNDRVSGTMLGSIPRIPLTSFVTRYARRCPLPTVTNNLHGNTPTKGEHKKRLPPFLLISMFSLTNVVRDLDPSGGCRRSQILANNSNKPVPESPEEEADLTPKGALLPDGLTFYTRYVDKDSKLSDFDRIIADCRSNGTFNFQIGLHAPIGTLQRGKAYQLGATARIKRVVSGRIEVYLNGVDPAAGVDYTPTTEVLELPF